MSEPSYSLIEAKIVDIDDDEEQVVLEHKGTVYTWEFSAFENPDDLKVDDCLVEVAVDDAVLADEGFIDVPSDE